ncbi:MAG: MarR family transcriptional regulator [Phycisphaerales bacterium]|nr:MAG: MarR family transcriptional regulator [Phycisphaerales bacterium]
MSNKDAHRRTRDDHAQETAQDYVEAVAEFSASRGCCRVKDLASRFGVSHVTVTRIVSRLVREGLLTTEPHRPIELTRRGGALAKRARERHDAVYAFLVAIGVPATVAAIDAEGIEHHASPKTIARFRAITRAKSPIPRPKSTPARVPRPTRKVH